jgi:hypothetical protein
MVSLVSHVGINLLLMIIGKVIASLDHSFLMSYTLKAKLISRPSRFISMVVERLLMLTLDSHRAMQ